MKRDDEREQHRLLAITGFAGSQRLFNFKVGSLEMLVKNFHQGP